MVNDTDFLLSECFFERKPRMCLSVKKVGQYLHNSCSHFSLDFAIKTAKMGK